AAFARLRRRTGIDEVAPVGDERLLDTIEVLADVVAEVRKELFHLAARATNDGFGQPAHRLFARRIEPCVLLANENRGLLHFRGQAVFGFAERTLGRLVEGAELLRRERLAVEDRERLHAALDGADAEAEGLGGRLETVQNLAIFHIELAGEPLRRF